MSSRKSKAAQIRMKKIADLAKEEDLTQSGSKRKRKTEGIFLLNVITEELFTNICFFRIRMVDGDDGFGAEDEDWMVYHEIKAEVESDDEEDHKSLEKYENLLIQYDPNFVSEEDIELEKRKTSLFHRLRFGPKGFIDSKDPEANNQLHLNTELIRVGEVLFQPSMIGVDQAGIVENIKTMISLLPPADVERICKNIFVTGSCAQIKGLKERLLNDITTLLPTGTNVHVTVAAAPVLSAWKSASAWAQIAFKQGKLEEVFVARDDYVKHGACVKLSKLSNKL